MGDQSCQAFVSSQEVEEEDGHVGNLPLSLPSYGPFFLSACQGACLPPDLSPGRLKPQVQRGKHANVYTQSCTQIHA